MEYKFTDLTAIADYFEHLGRSRWNEAKVWKAAAEILRNSEIEAPGHPVGDGMKRTQEIMERTLSEAEPQIRWLSKNPERDKGSTHPVSTEEKK